jgi:predicted transcriptional regulator of viral defense system
VLRAIKLSPSGILPLDVLASISPASRGTLLATLCRLAREKRIVRLKRGAYSVAPIRDGYAAAQAKFGGYIAFASALRLHGLISEEPFTITVATPNTSRTVRVGNLEFRAVALGERAVGSERIGAHVASSRAKTLFDCLFLPQYSVEPEKLADAYAARGMKTGEWREFERYVKMFGGRKARGMQEFGKRVRGARNGNA